jgi:Tol biopolymer transport system component
MNKYIEAFIVVMLIFLLCGNLSAVPSSARNQPQALVGSTERVSVSSNGRQGNEGSTNPSISADGRYVAFSSSATNLVRGDFNGFDDVFVYDRVTGETTLVSVSSNGTQSNNKLGNGNISISADGRYIAFDSWATNLVEGDTNNHCFDYGWDDYVNCPDVFVHDRGTGETILVSVASNGTQGNDLSLDPSVSADGRYVAFHSFANNLVVGDTNDSGDIFLHDRLTGDTTLVSVASDGTQANYSSFRPSISAYGDYIAFVSAASNLVAEDTNNSFDIFMHNRLNKKTIRVSVDSHGMEGNLSSGYLYPFPDFYRPSISVDGRFVAFQSGASNLVDGDTAICWGWEGMHLIYYNCSDIFIHDIQTGETTRVSIASDSTELVSDSLRQSISANGQLIAFDPWNKSEVVESTSRDVFVHDRGTGETTIISVSSYGIRGNYDSLEPSISADGRIVAFFSGSDNLVVGDTNETYDIFVRDREGLVVGYSVSGHVTDLDGNPLLGVTISTNYVSTTTTDDQGDYTLSGLQSGTYWLTAFLDDYTFIPIHRVTTVPPERVGINFTEGYPAFLPILNRE